MTLEEKAEAKAAGSEAKVRTYCMYFVAENEVGLVAVRRLGHSGPR